MKRSETVCLLCRLRVATTTRRTAAFAKPWQTDFSTSSSTRGHASAAVDNESVRPENARPLFRKTLTGAGPGVASLSTAERSRTANASSRSDDLFRQIVNGQLEQNHPQHRALDAAAQPVLDIGIVNSIGKLQTMLSNPQQNPVDAYRFWQFEIKPAIQAPGLHIPQAYYTVMHTLMMRIVEFKRVNIVTPGVPTVADIFRVYSDLGQIVPKEWATLLTELIVYVVNHLDLEADSSWTAHHDSRMEFREAVLSDLIESWKVLTLPRLGAGIKGDSVASDGFWFPRLDKSLLQKYRKKKDFTSAFSFMFPHYPRNQIKTPVALLAISTYVLLHDRDKASTKIRPEAARFMSKVGFLISFLNIREKNLRHALALRLPRLESYVMGLWPNIQAYLSMNEGKMSDGKDTTMVAGTGLSEPEKRNLVFNASFIGGRLNHAYDTRNIGEVDRVWQDFVGPSTALSEDRIQQIREHTHLIDSFIRVYMALNQPDKAIEAWSFLGRVNLRPTIRTWNLMLDGLKRAKNLNGMKNLWKKLVESDIPLDTGIWTTRVGGLIGCGDVKGGIKALEEMVSLWKTSRDDPTSTAVKPSIEPVNAALGAVLRVNHLGAGRKLLDWAAKHDIKPDIFTYNTLLRAVVRKDKTDANNTAEGILADMKAQGIQADSATFTIILDASFLPNHIPEPEVQAAIVDKVAHAMKAANLEPNMHTFGKMIYLLLRANNTSAAVALVNHLYDRDIEMTPHIYTALVQHCFVQQPPALRAVDIIVQRRRLLDLNHMDQMFYNRVVRGYVDCGQTNAALDVYQRVASRGRTIGLMPMQDLIVALVRDGRNEIAADILAQTRKLFEDSHSDPAEQRRYWDHSIWKVAERYGLLATPVPSSEELNAAVALARGVDATRYLTADIEDGDVSKVQENYTDGTQSPVDR